MEVDVEHHVFGNSLRLRRDCQQASAVHFVFVDSVDVRLPVPGVERSVVVAFGDGIEENVALHHLPTHGTVVVVDQRSRRVVEDVVLDGVFSCDRLEVRCRLLAPHPNAADMVAFYQVERRVIQRCGLVGAVHPGGSHHRNSSVAHLGEIRVGKTAVPHVAREEDAVPVNVVDVQPHKRDVGCAVYKDCPPSVNRPVLIDQAHKEVVAHM